MNDAYRTAAVTRPTGMARDASKGASNRLPRRDPGAHETRSRSGPWQGLAALLLGLILPLGFSAVSNAVEETADDGRPARETATRAGLELEHVMDDYWQAYLAAHPIEAADFGVDAPLDRLPDVSEAGQAAWTRQLEQSLAALGSVDAQGLSPSALEQAAVFRWMLEHELMLRGLGTRYFTISSLSGWHTDFAAVIGRGSYRSEADYRALIRLLQDFPRYAAEQIALLRQGIEAGYTQPCESLTGNEVVWLCKTIDGLLPRYFARLPRNPYGISIVPEQIAPRATVGYYQRGAADGSRAGQYFVNTWKLDSRPLYGLPALTLHEAVPGHHLQLSFHAENDALPAWRRQYYFHAYGEGWGLYSEWLGEEMGVYRSPYERFGRLSYEAWRAVRLVVDTGLHAMGWSRQEAMDYMLANTGLSEQNVIAEIDRYITYPAQAASYKLGELKLRELRALAEAELGEAFDLREFHVLILEGGSMPISVLEERVRRWISSSGTSG